MRYERACIPLGGVWSSPFCRWQGPLSSVSSLDLAVLVTERALADRFIDPVELSQLVLGWTIPQPTAFFGAPTVAARIGAPGITGPMLAQACATSVACIAAAAAGIEGGEHDLSLAVLTDRTSNGPHLVYPMPSNQGGTVLSEDWVLDNFRRDPWAGESMVVTAENVAREGGFSRQQIDEITLLRYDQYRSALTDDRAFQRRYMVPVELPARRGESVMVDDDYGVHETTAEGLAALRSSVAGGVVSSGSQTHPADGAAGLIVTTEDRARTLGRDGGIVRLLGSSFARAGKALMPKAPVPAARAALDAAGLPIEAVDVVTTHNPFAVNDLWFCKELGVEPERLNPYGCSLVYGHPQAPTGARAIAELTEALALRGGGIGLFTGCAAGDTGAAVVLRVEG
jgi:acetyl-CoA acyltransferase